MKFSRAVYPLIAVLAASTLALTPGGAGAASLSSQVALDWNLNAVTAVRAAQTMDEVSPGGTPRGLYQLEGLIYMSYVQAAVYDATMKISHRYQLYHHFSAGAGHASLQAAVIAASYNTLVFYLGDAHGTLAAKYQAAISALPTGKETRRGIAVGEAAAADIEALRAGDGRNAAAPYACPTATNPLTPGAYVCTPSSIQTLQTPWVGSMRPFLLPSASAFRAPAPPALNSASYVNDLAEVKTAIDNSAARPDQKATALFWNLNAIAQLNRTLRDAATQYGMDLVDTVRLLAMGEMVPTDAGIGCWDSKYHYMFWRPITAIQAGGDSSWIPLVATPNHPEYPSAHGCLTSALVETLAAALGTRSFNLTIIGAATGTPTISRTFATANDVTSQLVDARVWIGFHYRNSVVAGEALGTAVSTWALARNFLPAAEAGDDSRD